MTAGHTQRRNNGLPEEIQKILRQHPVFRQLRQAAWVCLLDTARREEHAAGDTICREGQGVTTVWLVLEGEVKLVRHTTRGQLLLVDIMLRGEVFGAVFYATDPVHPVSAVALKPTRLLALPLGILLEEMRSNPGLQNALLEDTCLKLCQSIALRGLALEELPIRVAAVLCRLHEKFGPVIPETRATLAELAGTTTESAIRVTRELQERGILRLHRGRIEILDPCGLCDAAAIPFRSSHVHHRASLK